MTFGVPQWFWALLGLPVLLLLFVRSEGRTAERLRLFVSARLLPDLAGNVNKWRRALRFALQVLALTLAVVSLAKPRWGYSIEEVHRRGIDIFIAVDTSRSMLSNDVQPSRLERVKLSTQDLISQLEGDRVGLIAFAGRAFVQAPLTIDYGAVIDAIRDLNTETIPEGGTNISEAIGIAAKTYGKSATGNRALIIFTDGEDLSGDAIRAAKAAADQGVRIFTVGVGTPQGSLIPIKGEDAQSKFVKDEKGQVVKSKLDEKRLREIAETTGGTYLHLDNGARSLQQLVSQGIARMQAGDIDVRLNRRPIERYEWPLGAAVLCLAAGLLLRERRKQPSPGRVVAARVALSGIMLGMTGSLFGAAPGIEAYNDGKFEEAYGRFHETLQTHPQNPAIDRLNFDAGAAAYKLKDYNKALQSFSQALLSKDLQLQEKTHYNLGNTLYEQGETEKTDDRKLANWTNAVRHYDETLKIDSQDKQAQENREFVKKKIEELKNKKPSPTPSPSPSQSNQQNKNKDQDKDKAGQQDQQNQQQQQQKKDSSGQGQQQQQQQQQQSGNSDQKDQKDGSNQSNSEKNDDKKNTPKSPSPSPSPGESPSPSTNGSPSASASPSPTASPGEEKGDTGSEPSASPSPSPSAGTNNGMGDSGSNGGENQPSPSAAPNATPPKKFSGDIKGSGDTKPQESPSEAQTAEEDKAPDGQMSERQALALLQSIQDEEARVPLDERKAARRVYKDW